MKKRLSIIVSLFLLVAFSIQALAFTSVPVKSIKLNAGTISIKVGQTYTLKATLNPQNTTQKALTFSTANAKVAAVDKTGKIKGIMAGKTVVTVTVTSTINKKVLAKCNVTVTDVVIKPAFVEMWYINMFGFSTPKNGKIATYLAEKTGVGYYAPSVLWDGGNIYTQKFQLRAATDELPDMFIPWNAMETNLIKDGQLADLKDYLPKYAPNIWTRIPKSVWDAVAAADPSGKGGIYYIPSVDAYNDYGTFIRQDWLDKVGMKAPTNQKEYVEVLRAFRDKDPNGNGQKDEIPTIGRELGRWMDHLFHMYDVAMIEGYPQFDLYNGELTYSAVTPNMKEALKFINSLYMEGLLDNNVFLNKSNDLWAKVNSDKVGSFFYIPRGTKTIILDKLKLVAPNAQMTMLPKLAAKGYNGYISNKYFKRYKEENGKWVVIPLDKQTECYTYPDEEVRMGNFNCESIFSFICGNRSSSEWILPENLICTSGDWNNGKRQHLLSWKDTETSLACTVELAEFIDFPAIEWVIRLRNEGSKEAGPVRDFKAVDLMWRGEKPDETPELYYYLGSDGRHDDFQYNRNQLRQSMWNASKTERLDYKHKEAFRKLRNGSTAGNAQ